MCEILNIDVPAVLVLPHSTYNYNYLAVKITSHDSPSIEPGSLDDEIRHKFY